jgi:hypothetical protein
VQGSGQRAAEKVSEREASDLGESGPKYLLSFGATRIADIEEIDKRGPCIPNRFESPFGASASSLFDQDRGARSDIQPDICFYLARVADMDRDVGIVEPPRQQPIFDEKLDIQGGRQSTSQEPNDQLLLANRKALHC